MLTANFPENIQFLVFYLVFLLLLIMFVFVQDDSPTCSSEPVFDLSDISPTGAACSPPKGKGSTNFTSLIL